MREGMNVRGLNTAATLWCSAAIGVLCGLGQFWQAAAATLIILCANILLYEAAQRINHIPGATEEEKCYVLNIICHSEHENAIRQQLLAISKEMRLSLLGLASITAQEQGHKEIGIELAGNADYRKARDLIMEKIGGHENITSVRWAIEGS